jgi:glucan phosphoethanolaminetransferase (alkaline phosphatase superfamily)
VRPAAMVWPGTLMSTAMFTTMHKQENEPANGWTISRYRFFVYVWLGAFAWYFLPGLLFPALSYFSVVTWFAPKNVVVANLVGLLASHECLRLIDSVWRCVWSWTVSHDL